MSFIRHGKSCDESCCLRISNLSVKIGGDKILKDVNFHIHCGQMVAFIGPNGAGKSTLIKAILGQREYEGVIAFSAPGMRHRKPPRIGYVPQSPSFDPGDPVSVADLFACCQSKRPAFLGLNKAMREKVLECLERVHGEDLIDKRVGTLSGGELQRVLLALALEPMPNILILDEPLSGVDVIENFYVKIPAAESDINAQKDSLQNPYLYSDPEDSNTDLLLYFAIALVVLLFWEWWLHTREQY